MCSRPLALANVHYTSAQRKSISRSLARSLRRCHGDANANVRALFVQLTSLRFVSTQMCVAANKTNLEI